MAEHQYTVTGGMADHRLPVRVSEQAALINEVAKQVAELTGDAKLKSLVKDGQVSDSIKNWIAEVVKDLHENKGKSVLLAGNRQDEEVHALCFAINNALGNIGSNKAIEIVSGAHSASGTIAELAQAINDGKISTLVISSESDPVYSAPADLKFDELVSKVETVIHLGVRNLCASARASDWHVPGSHFLESWGDVRASDGTYSVIQPMIAPLFDGVSEIGFLLKLISDKEPAAGTDPVQDAVKETFKAIAGADSESLWNTTLRNGFLRDSQYSSAAAEIDYESAKGIIGIMLLIRMVTKLFSQQTIKSGMDATLIMDGYKKFLIL